MRVGAVALAVLWAVLTAAPVFGQSRPASCRTVHVVDNGWHTGIIIPARNFAPARFLGSDYFKGKEWLEFGWGDAGFYQAKDISAGLALRALFWPTEAVMHVYGFNGAPPRVFRKNQLVTLHIPASGYRKLLDGLRGGFARGTAGQVIPLKPGLHGRSHFYRGTGSYSVMRTCNTWTAEVLAAGGVAIDPDDAARASDVMWQLRRLPQDGCPQSVIQR
jgi:uncharacterized protein (TIGR02117 family)